MEELSELRVERIVKGPDWEGKAQFVLFLLISVFFLLLAVPLLIIFFVKSPQSWQDVSMAGVSFQKLLFLFLLSSSLIAYIGVFFLKARPAPILLVFALSLFCCFPLIVGLKNNLTLHQVITEGPFFQNWPFLLRPAYLLMEFLLPAAVVVYLVLQVRAIVSRKRHGYAFFAGAVYLIMASCFGFLALHQAGQPNAYSAVARVREQRAGAPASERRQFPIPRPDSHAGQPKAPAVSHPVVLPLNPPPKEESAPVGFERKLQVLTEKVDRILEILGAEKRLEKPASGEEPALAGGADQTSVPAMPANLPPNPAPNPLSAAASVPLETGPASGVTPQEEVSPQVRDASEKVDRIMETLNQVEKLLPANGTASLNHEATAHKEEASEPVPPKTAGESPADRGAKENLNGRIQAISDKMDRILEALAKMERRLSGH